MGSRIELFVLLACASLGAQAQATKTPAAAAPAFTDYVVGAQDVLTILSYD